MDQKNLADLYGLDPIPWSRALEALEATEPTQSSFIATTRPDGRPHLAGVGVLWDDGTVYFVSGAGTRKSRNLVQNANCAISTALKGIDLVFEGVAERVIDDETLRRIAKRYGAQGWPAVVEDGAFTYDYSAPSAGPPPWDLFAVRPATVFGVLTSEPAVPPAGASRPDGRRPPTDDRRCPLGLLPRAGRLTACPVGHLGRTLTGARHWALSLPACMRPPSGICAV